MSTERCEECKNVVFTDLGCDPKLPILKTIGQCKECKTKYVNFTTSVPALGSGQTYIIRNPVGYVVEQKYIANGGWTPKEK